MIKSNISKNEISTYLDITEPFLMIDSINEMVPGKSAQSSKQLKKNEWFFNCHLLKSRVMPATLLIEGMLQTFVLLIYATEAHKENYAYITNIDVKIISSVLPEQKIHYHANILSSKRGITKGTAFGEVKDKIVCEGKFEYASPHLFPSLNCLRK